MKLTLTPGKELLEAVSTDIERDPMRRNEVPEITAFGEITPCFLQHDLDEAASGRAPW